MTVNNRTTIAGLDVSRETANRLVGLQALVQKWTMAINLISKASADDLFDRHIVDSAQVFSLAPKGISLWADLGSGGGFPGLVVACIATEKAPKVRVALVESDLRKCTFLRHASHALALNTYVFPERIEHLGPLDADVVSARALAPLPTLCAYASRHLSPGGVAIFHKGAQYRSELEQAKLDWHFQATQIESITDKAAVILKLESLSHA